MGKEQGASPCSGIRAQAHPCSLPGTLTNGQKTSLSFAVVGYARYLFSVNAGIVLGNEHGDLEKQL